MSEEDTTNPLNEPKASAEEHQQLDQTIQQISSSEELDRSIIVVNPHLWIANYTLIFLTIALLIWAFFGSIPIKIQGSGIFIDKEGLYTAQAKTDGTVETLPIKQGSFVKKGDLIAEVVDPQLDLKLKLSKIKVKAMQKGFDRLKSEIEGERAKQKEAILAKIQAAKFNIQESEDEIEKIKKDLEIRKNLVSQGLIPNTNLRDTEREYAQKESSLATQKSDLVTLNSDLEKGYRTEELKTQEGDLLQAIDDNKLLQLTRDFAKIYSPFDGDIIEVLVNKGDRVTTGASLALMEHQKDPNSKPSFIVYGFVPVDLGKRIKIGLPVQMALSTVQEQEFGKMLGHVTDVSEFAVSPERLAKLIPNQALLSFLLGANKAVIQLEITPERDPSTPSGYKWTTAEGSPIPITSGTVCKIEAIIEEVKPFYFVFPFQGLRKIIYFEHQSPVTEKSTEKSS